MLYCYIILYTEAIAEPAVYDMAGLLPSTRTSMMVPFVIMHGFRALQ